VVFLPIGRVTGFSAMVAQANDGRSWKAATGEKNSSQRVASFGPACRFTFDDHLFLFSAINPRPPPASGPRRARAAASIFAAS